MIRLIHYESGNENGYCGRGGHSHRGREVRLAAFNNAPGFSKMNGTDQGFLQENLGGEN